MSRGLGRIERLILESLQRKDSHEVLGVWDLAYMVHNGIDCFARTIDDPQPEKPPYAVYQSVCRAARKLEKKGIIRGRKRLGWESRHENMPWSKCISLSV